LLALFLLRKKEVSLQVTNETRSWRWIIALTLTGPVLAVGSISVLVGESIAYLKTFHNAAFQIPAA